MNVDPNRVFDAAPWRFYNSARVARILGVTKADLGALSEPASGVEWVNVRGKSGALVRLYRADTVDALAKRLVR